MLLSLSIKGEPLGPGEHSINVSVLTREIGRIKFDLKDNLA
jgi:hypothetical protein